MSAPNESDSEPTDNSQITNLPREILAYCLAFLPLHELQPYSKDAYRERELVHYAKSVDVKSLWTPPSEAKRVSKDFRAAARHALTRGRWRPLKLFCEKGLAAVSGPGSAPPVVPDDMQALFREVWNLEPCGVLVELSLWPGGGEEGNLEPEAALRYLDVVEPCLDGYGRMLAAFAAFEHARHKPEDEENYWWESANYIFKKWWFRTRPVDEDGEDVLLSDVLSEETLVPALRAWDVFTSDELERSRLYNCGPGLGAQFMMKNFRHWHYRPVHSFLRVLRNDWQDRDMAAIVIDAVERFRIWGPAIWYVQEIRNDEIDVPRDIYNPLTDPAPDYY